MSRRLAFAIHDFNPWGGQDKSTMEIARHLSRYWPVDLHAFTYQDNASPFCEFHPVWPPIRRPVLLKSTLYYLTTLARFLKKDRPLIHATGACSLICDVIQVQFLHAKWKRVLGSLPPESKDPIRHAYHHLMMRYNLAFESKIFKRDKTYIAISRNVAADVKNFYGASDKVHVVHHGVDSNEFRPLALSEASKRLAVRKQNGIAENAVVIVFVGAYARKGLATAIEAIAKLPADARKNACLLAVGGGNKAQFLELAERLGVSRHVKLIGHSKDVVSLYHAADAFLLPTYYEAFGLVILEAMACGLAPIVSRSAGASELLEHQVSGMLIDDPTSSQEIANHLARVISDEKFRQEMGQHARQVAVSRPWSKVAEEYAAILAPLMSNR